MPTGATRQSTMQRCVLRVDEIDIPNRQIHGYDKTNVLVVATFRETPAGILQVPAQNERWVAERQGMGQWRLVGRLDSADQQTWVEANLDPGDMRIEADNIYLEGDIFLNGVVSYPSVGDGSRVLDGLGQWTVPSTEALAILSLDPKLYWRLGESSGTVAHDSSGYGLDGKCDFGVTFGHPGGLIGDPATSAFLPGSPAEADENGGDIVSAYKPFALGSKRTFVGWSNVLGNVHGGPVFFGGKPSGWTFGWLFNDGTTVAFSAGSVITWANAWPGYNQWVHWAFTYDDTISTAELFINGVSKGAVVGSPYNIAGVDDVFVAAYEDGLNGYQQDMAVFESILTSTEIKMIYNAGLGPSAGGGGGGTVTSVTAGDASIVIGGTSTAPTVETADLSTIASTHATAGSVSMNSNKITNLTAGVASQDAVNVSQIPTSLPPSGSAGGSLAGTYPNPTIASNVNLPGAPTTTTPSTADNSTKIATTAYVQAQGYLTSSTGVTSFNTRTGAVTLLKADVTGTGLSFSDVGALGATAAAGGDLAGNYPNPTIKSSVGLSGNPTTTTQTASDSSTKIATTAFTQAAIAAASVVKIQITQTSHGFSVGNVLYYTGSAYALAKADNADDAEVVGIVATVVDANNFILQAVGEVTGLSGLTAGTTYFLSDATAGLLTATAPTANGSILKPLGIAVSTTVLFFYNWRGEIISAAASFPTVTTSAFSGGPPSSPSDGDIWMASGVDTNGTRWQFQYNAGSSSAYKWEFVGGPPMIQQDSTRTARLVGSNSAWLAVPGISNIVTARGGDYITHVTGWMQGSVGSTTYCGVGLTGGSDPNIHYISENASNSISQAAHGVQTGIAANSTWKLFMFTSDFTTASITDPAFSIIPVRVS